MFYHFCFILLLASTSYGQYSIPLRNNPLTNLSKKPVGPNNLAFGVVPNGNGNNFNDSITVPSYVMNGLIPNNSTSGRQPVGPGSGTVTTIPPVYGPNKSTFGGQNINFGNGSGYDPNAFPSNRSDSAFRRKPINSVNSATTEQPPISVTSSPPFGGVSINFGNESAEQPIAYDPNDSGFGRVPIVAGNEAITEPSPIFEPSYSEFGDENNTVGNGAASGPDESITSDPNTALQGGPIYGGDEEITELPTIYDPSGSESGLQPTDASNGAIAYPDEPITSGPNDSSFGGLPVDIGNVPVAYPTSSDLNDSTSGKVPTDVGNEVGSGSNVLPPTSNPNNSTLGRESTNAVNSAKTEQPPISDPSIPAFGGPYINDGNGAAEQPITYDPNDSGIERVPIDVAAGAVTKLPSISDPSDSAFGGENNTFVNEAGSGPDEPITPDPNTAHGREPIDGGDEKITELPTTYDPSGLESGLQPTDASNGAIAYPDEPITSGPNDSSFGGLPVDIGNVPVTYPTSSDLNDSTSGKVPTDVGNEVGSGSNVLPPTSNPNNSTFGRESTNAVNSAKPEQPPISDPSIPAFGGPYINDGNGAAEQPITYDPNDSGIERVPIDVAAGAVTKLPSISDPSDSAFGGENNTFVNEAGSGPDEPITPDPNTAHGREPIDGGDEKITELPTTYDPSGLESGLQPTDTSNGAIAYPDEPITSGPNDSSFGGLPVIGSEPITYPTTSDLNDSTFGRDSTNSGNGVATDASKMPTTSSPNDSTSGGASVDFGNGAVTDTSALPTTSKQDNSTPRDVPIEFGGVTNATKVPDNLSQNNSTSERAPNYNNSGLEPSREPLCEKRYGYFSVERNCDSYIECRNYRPVQRLCPDGMHFNPKARWSEYPCGYPQDVPCIGRGFVQRPQPTNQCPHQFGFFPLNDPSKSPKEKCSRYIMCSAGNAVIMDCPFGLVFDAASGQCNWPANVPDCRDILGFQCPIFEDGVFDDRVRNYEYSPGECRYFWSCIGSDARVLSCDIGLAFDPNTSTCVDEDLVQCNHDSDNDSESEYEGPVA